MPTWTIEEITSQLAALNTWSKPVFQWPSARWVLQDPVKRAFCREAARLSQSIGIGVYPHAPGVDVEAIQAAIATIKGLPSWVQWCVSATPYHYVPGSEFAGEWGTPHDQDVAFYLSGLRAVLLEIINRQQQENMTNRVGMIYLDTERSDLQANGELDHDRQALAKFSVVYDETKQVCREVLGYDVPVTFYGHGTLGLSGNWRNVSQTPPGAPSACVNPILYQWEDPHLCVEIYNRSLAVAGEGVPVCPAICLSGGFARDWNTWPNAGDWVRSNECPRLNSWLAGLYLMRSPWMNNDESGKFENAPFAFMWPGPMPDAWKYWGLQFLSFARGCHGIASLPEGEPAYTA